jgi:hypothetical protein
MEPEEQTEDTRRRPIVLQARGADAESARRSPARYFAWAGTGMIALAAAAGLVAGGTAVWSAFDPGTPGQSPAPLWFPPPATVQPQAATVSPTPTPAADDHGGRREDPTNAPTSTGSSKSTTEPGDDKGGSSKSGSSSGETTVSSGKGSDDKSGRR